MQLPAHVLACSASLHLIVRVLVTQELPATGYYEAWEALEDPAGYEPNEEVRIWLHEHWKELTPGQLPAALVKLGGRPSKLTEELLTKVEELAEDGLKDAQIYATLSVAKRTWYHWLEHEAGFAELLARARAKLARRLLKLIPTMEKGWQAPVWLLNQTFPEDYSRPNVDGTTVNVSATASANAEAQATSLVVTKEKIEQLQERTRQRHQRQMQKIAQDRQAQGLPVPPGPFNPGQPPA